MYHCSFRNNSKPYEIKMNYCNLLISIEFFCVYRWALVTDEHFISVFQYWYHTCLTIENHINLLNQRAHIFDYWRLQQGMKASAFLSSIFFLMPFQQVNMTMCVKWETERPTTHSQPTHKNNLEFQSSVANLTRNDPKTFG